MGVTSELSNVEQAFDLNIEKVLEHSHAAVRQHASHLLNLVHSWGVGRDAAAARDLLSERAS